MSQRLTRIIFIASALGALTIITLGLLSPASHPQTIAHEKQPQVGSQQGNIAPNFTLTTLDGQKVSLSDYRGRPVMLNFWEVNCTGCRDEIPGMEKLYTQWQAGHKNIVILGIDFADTQSNAQQFIRMQGITYSIALDQHSMVRDMYNVEGTPTSFFLNRQGIIANIEIGPINEPALQRMFEQLSS